LTGHRLRNCAFILLALNLAWLAETARSEGSRTIREFTASPYDWKHPETKEVYTLRIDLATQVLRLELPQDRGYLDHDRGGTDWRKPVEQGAKIHSRPIDLPQQEFCSASILAQKAKQFDDGLYAAVERAAAAGTPRFGSKSELIDAVARSMDSLSPAEGNNVAAVLIAGRHLGLGSQPDDLWSESPHRGAAEELLERFLAADFRSKPIGFYTWSPALSDIFRQDRMLQSELTGREQITALARSLAESPDLDRTYRGYLDLVSRLTNPFPPEYRPISTLNLNEPVPAESVYFFPPSRGHETELIKRLFGNQPIPEGFSLIEELIKRIRQGEIDLAPTETSGWYDHQVYALGPMVTPRATREADRLEFDETYRAHLLDLFRGLIALTRETHVKQLEVPMAGAEMAPPTIDISPELSAEPLATYYLRRAMSYRFVRTVLEETFDPDVLNGIHRLTADGPVELRLTDELDLMEALFYGAHAVVCGELGLEPEPGPPGRVANTDADRFRAWTKVLSDDVDLGVDARMMVPVFYDIGRRMTKVWVFLGWSARPLDISFAEPPDLEVLDEQGRIVPSDKVELRFEPRRQRVTYPVMAEVYVKKVMNRAEFRSHCDRFGTQKEILANLH